MLAVLDLDPMRRSTGPVRPVDQFFEPEQTGVAERSGPIAPCSKSLRKMPSTRRASSRDRFALRMLRGSLRRSSPSLTRHIERVELHLGIVPARVQAVEIRSAVDAEQHGLAVEDERAVAVSKRSLGDQRKAIAPVAAVPGPQPHAFVLAMHDQPIAVMLDLVDPVGAVGNGFGAARNARFKRGFEHAG